MIMNDLGGEPARKIVNRIRDLQLRHRVYQVSLKETRRAIRKLESIEH